MFLLAYIKTLHVMISKSPLCWWVLNSEWALRSDLASYWCLITASSTVDEMKGRVRETENGDENKTKSGKLININETKMEHAQQNHKLISKFEKL